MSDLYLQYKNKKSQPTGQAQQIDSLLPDGEERPSDSRDLRLP